MGCTENVSPGSLAKGNDDRLQPWVGMWVKVTLYQEKSNLQYGDAVV